MGRRGGWSRREFVRSGAAGAGTLLTGCGDEPGPSIETGEGEGGGASSGESALETGSSGEEPTTGDGTDGTVDSAGPERRPANIIVLTADDLGWKSLPAYGNDQVSTPAIDRLAAEGVLLTHAFNASSSCSSSRATFATGQYVASHGVNGLVHRFPAAALPPDHPTAALVLRDAGYRTGVHGKWHITLGDPAIHGYDENLNTDERLSERFRSAERAIDFITRHQDVPFYLEVNFLNTHLISNGTYPIEDDFPVDPDGIVPLPIWTMPDWPEVRAMAAGYFSQMLKMDQMIGDILDALDELGLTGDTFVILVSDNGPPFPGNKKTMFDRGIGTPWIARWPGRIPAGRSSSALVSTVDLAPSLLGVVGLHALDGADGQSMLGLMMGDTEEGRDAIFAALDYHSTYTPTRAVRTERYKLIRNLGDTPIGLGQLGNKDWAHAICELPNQPWKLPPIPIGIYDLEADPDEQINLVSDSGHAPVLEELAERLRAHMEAVGDPLLPLL